MPSTKGPRKSSKQKRALSTKPRVIDEPEIAPPEARSHKHCLNCGISISPDRETCSEKCQQEWDKMIKRKKFWNYLPFLGAAFLLVLYLIMSMA